MVELAGHEHFYGFIGGENNQYYPALYDGTTPVEPDRTPDEGYHLTADQADKAIGWIRQQKALGVIPHECELTARPGQMRIPE